MSLSFSKSHAWRKSTKRKAITTANFYWFDTGVANTLARVDQLPVQSDLYGRAFEHFIVMELRAYLSCRRDRRELGYWRSVHQHEVDFTVGDELAVEVKAAAKVSERDLRGLKALAEERVFNPLILVSRDPTPRKLDGIEILPWELFLKRLWVTTCCNAGNLDALDPVQSDQVPTHEVVRLTCWLSSSRTPTPSRTASQFLRVMPFSTAWLDAYRVEPEWIINHPNAR